MKLLAYINARFIHFFLTFDTILHIVLFPEKYFIQNVAIYIYLFIKAKLTKK